LPTWTGPAVTALDVALFDQAWGLIPVIDRNGDGWMETEEAEEYVDLISNYIGRGIRSVESLQTYDLDGDLFISRDDLNVIDAAQAERRADIRSAEDYMLTPPIFWRCCRSPMSMATAMDDGGSGRLAPLRPILTYCPWRFPRALTRKISIKTLILTLTFLSACETDLYDLNFGSRREDVRLMRHGGCCS
jgi:hypothetical protein